MNAIPAIESLTGWPIPRTKPRRCCWAVTRRTREKCGGEIFCRGLALPGHQYCSFHVGADPVVELSNRAVRLFGDQP
jgi:hypothetical protein